MVKSRERERGTSRTEYTLGFLGLKSKGHTAPRIMKY